MFFLISKLLPLLQAGSQVIQILSRAEEAVFWAEGTLAK